MTKFSEFLSESLSRGVSSVGFGHSGEDEAYRCVHMFNTVSEILKDVLRNADYTSVFKNNLKKAKKAEKDNNECIEDIELILKTSNDVLKCLKDLSNNVNTVLKPLTKKYEYKPRTGISGSLVH